jgi:hypothetical protein
MAIARGAAKGRAKILAKTASAISTKNIAWMLIFLKSKTLH